MKPDDTVNASFLRHEFKISGQIGELGQADKLTFVLLTHQIDSGLKHGYNENEIVDTVIRAISLHSSLRSYVKTLKDLSLPKLQKIYTFTTVKNLCQNSIKSVRKLKCVKNGSDNDKILAKIQEIKSDLESLKKQANNANANLEVSSGSQKFPRET